MTRVAFQPRVYHFCHTRLLLQPARHLQRALFVHRHAGIECAHAAQDQPRIITAHAHAQLPHGGPQLLPQRLAHHHGAHQHIGVTAPVLGQCQDRDVHTPVERTGQLRRGIGVVDGGQNATLARPATDGRRVLDVEGITARAFQVHHTCARTHQLFQIVRRGLRIEVDGLHTELLQQCVIEGSGRPIDRIGHQNLVSRRSERPHQRADCCQSRRHQGGTHLVRRTFQFGHRVHQCIGGFGTRRSVAGLMQLTLIGAVAHLDGILHGIEHHAGGPDQRWIHHTDAATDAVACLDGQAAQHRILGSRTPGALPCSWLRRGAGLAGGVFSGHVFPLVFNKIRCSPYPHGLRTNTSVSAYTHSSRYLQHARTGFSTEASTHICRDSGPRTARRPGNPVNQPVFTLACAPADPHLI